LAGQVGRHGVHGRKLPQVIGKCLLALRSHVITTLEKNTNRPPLTPFLGQTIFKTVLICGPEDAALRFCAVHTSCSVFSLYTPTLPQKDSLVLPMPKQFVIGRRTFFDFSPQLSRRATRLQVVSGCEASPKGLYSPETGCYVWKGYTDEKSVERRNICEC
jgi:hypothetical protein